jgi:hypothetical protein
MRSDHHLIESVETMYLDFLHKSKKNVPRKKKLLGVYWPPPAPAVVNSVAVKAPKSHKDQQRLAFRW